MTNITVEEIDNTFDDLMVVNAARVSFGKWHDSFDTQKDSKLIDYLVKNNHWSPCAHPHTTVSIETGLLDPFELIQHKNLLAGLHFYNKSDDTTEVTGSLWGLLNLAKHIGDYSLFSICSNNAPVTSEAFEKYIGKVTGHNSYTKIVNPSNDSHEIYSMRISAPIFVARQLVKHKEGTVWNEISRRYVDTDLEFLDIDEIREKADNKKQGSSETIINPLVCYGVRTQPLPATEAIKLHFENTQKLYNQLLETHVCPEQARAIQPVASMTQWIWTMTQESMERVIDLRGDSHSQKETSIVSTKMKEML